MHFVVASVMQERYVVRIQADVVVVDILVCQLCLVMPDDVVCFNDRLVAILADDVSVCVLPLWALL
jgi:hypothetical protein